MGLKSGSYGFAKLGAAALMTLALAQPSYAADKVLRVGMATGDIGKMDPHVAAGTPEKVLFTWIFNGLVRIKPGEANPKYIEPDLAESWEHSPDNLTWTFHLRQGVQCHGGYGEFTAEDAVYSLERAADPKRSSFSSDFKSIESVTAPDKYTVKITYKEHIPSVLGFLVNIQGGNMVCKKAAEEMGADFAKHPIGTGPFMFKDYKPQQEVVLVANPTYFRGKPKIDEIDYKFIQAIASRDLAFEKGELDMSYGQSDQAWYDRMKKLPHTVVAATEPTELYTVHINQAHAPLDNLKVRQAIAMSIPRDAIVKYRGEKIAREAKSVVPQGYLGYSDAEPLPAYDPKKAKALLKEAGYPDGIKLTVVQTSLGIMRDTMEVLQGQMRKAGIDLDLQIVEHATFHADIRKDKSDLVLYAASRFPIADIYLSQFYDSASIVGTPTAVANFSHCNVADDEIRAARVETDPDKQLAEWALAQKKIIDAVCSVPVYELFDAWAISDKLNLGYELKGAPTRGIPITEASVLN